MVSISFKYKGKDVKIKSENSVESLKDVCNWLYDNGYKFEGTLHSSGGRNIMSIGDIKNKNIPISRVYNIKGSGKFIGTTTIGNISVRLKNIILMLENFGVESSTIKTEGFESTTRVKKFGEFESEDVESTEKMTFVKAAQIILQDNDNEPMSASEIWDEISERELYKTEGQTPKASLNAIMLAYSDNSSSKRKFKTKLFNIVDKNPAKFILINPEEIQDVPEEEIQDVPEEETESKTKVYVKSPFRQSICILGPSGKGKSYTTELVLEQLENTKDSEFEFIIPTASTTGLLSQYSPKGEYIKSRLGRMIMSAHNNPERLFTAVFDECHKSAVIEMINDELLQCISTRRNAGRRFISVDEETGDLYTGLSTHRGNLLIPDNFGFIFLSSKPDVIISNSDFFNRVDIYVLTEQPSKDSDLSLDYDEEGNVILPSYFTKIEGKDKDAEDDINNLLQ